MRKAVILIWCILVGWMNSLSAQPQCTVTHYDEFSGMAQWYVTQIVQDQQGMMWFATWNGLNRYDGYEFVCFKSRVGDGIDMPSDRIRDIVLAKDGSLRCLVDTRVFGFCTKTCKFFQLPEAEERQLKVDFDHSHQKELAFEHAGEPNFYKDLYGTEWAVGQKGRLMYKNPSTGQYTDYPAEWHGAARIRFCTADKEGNAWFTSSFGVFKLSFQRKPYHLFEHQAPDQVRCFYVDKKQRYWITTRNDATVRLYDSNNHLLGYLGHDGRLHSQYTSFGSPIYHIMQDSKGNYWLSSKPDGLFRLKEAVDDIFSIDHFIHKENDIHSLSDNDLYNTIEDQYGRLWVATFNQGVNCIPDPQATQPVFLHHGNGLQVSKDLGLRVRQFHIARGHILMAATTTGLLVADISPKDAKQIVFKHHTKDIHRSNSLSNNATMYVAEDSRHRIFVCTESGGVNQILTDDLPANQLEFRHFNTSTGLPSDVALSAVAYGDNMLIVSNNQLMILMPDSEQLQSHESFFWQDKLRFSDATPTILPDGRAIFGLQNGAFTIRMEDIKKSTFVPPIAWTGLSIENQQTEHAVNALDTLVLVPDERNLILRFAALDYSSENQTLYAFRFGNGSEAWSHIGKDHSVTLLDLKPGTYLLQIRSTNNDGVWVDNIRTLTIIVKPTFWETRWAQLLYVLLLALLIWGILRTRRYIITLKRHQQELHEAYLTLLNAKGTNDEDMKRSEEQPAKPKMKPEDEMFMQRAMKFIEEHISDADINIGDMADATATSRSGLNRKMKSLLGVTPLDFIREARIRKACQMLKDGAAVNDVAYNCGFSDPKYFGKCFKADIGMTPTEYKVENSVK